MLPRLLLSLALGVNAAALGAVVLNWLYPVVDQGLAGGAIVLFRGVATGVIAALLAFLLYPLLQARLARWMLLLLGIPALVLLALLATAVRQSQLEQAAYVDEVVANLPPYRIYLANGEQLPAPRFIDIEFESERQLYSVRYNGDRSCTGSLPETATQKVQLLQALRALEGLFLEQPALCTPLTPPWRYSLSFEIHDVKPPHTQYSVLLDDACLETYPALRHTVEMIEQVHDELQRSEHCE